MSTSEVILYDVPSRAPCKAWSGNTLKTRIALNYKGIPYKTEWTPYTRIKPTLVAAGLPPNADGPTKWADYTVPAVRMPDGTMIMDSAKIAPALENLKPEPSLFLEEEDLIKEAYAGVTAIFLNILPEFGVDLPAKILVEEDVEWWKEDRRKRFGGLTLEELKEKRGGEQAWEGAQPGFEKIASLLGEHKRDEGPFVLGSKPCYADFIVLGFVEFQARVMGGKGFERLLEEVEGLGDLYEAGKKWCETK